MPKQPRPEPSTYGLVGMLVVGEPSTAHPGYVEVKLNDRTSDRHGEAVLLLLEEYARNSKLTEGDEVELWTEEHLGERSERQVDMFGGKT